MTPSQIVAVQSSFDLVTPIREQAAALFYDRLFAIDPTTRPMFKGDVTEQGKKLMVALAMVVASLQNLEKILPAVEEMARRHTRYGVEDRHYDTVGEALLWTLEQGLGDAFTTDVKAAWTEAYVALAGIMKATAT